MSKRQLICMSFDGEYQRESPEFETAEEAWEYSNDLGSKWYFYPFHFVVSNKTIVDAPNPFEHFIGKRIATVQKAFNAHSLKPETQGMDADNFAYSL